MERIAAHDRADYRTFVPITTRWADNDLYGHVNNVAFYGFFDSAANQYLVEAGGLDIHEGPVIGLVVESKCNYFAPLAFPQRLQAGVRVDRLGSSSVTWGIAIFAEDWDTAAAQGHFMHVFVDRKTRKPASIPEAIRAALEQVKA